MKSYEDFNVGDEFMTQGRTITDADVVLFAGLTGDYNPIHVDEEFSKQRSVFKTRVVHGLFTLSVAEGLFFSYGWLESGNAITVSYNDVKFTEPVFIGDTIHFSGKVKMKRESKSNPGWGIIEIGMTGLNQKNIAFLSFEHVYLVRRKGE